MSSFSYLNEGFHFTVSFGDFSSIEVMGKGYIIIKSKNEFVVTISNVLYVLDLKSNFFLGLKALNQKNIVTRLPLIVALSQVCQDCIVDKQHCSQFPKHKSWRATNVLELIHSNICNPISPSSNGGKLGSTFYRKNLKCYLHLRILKLMLKMRLEKTSKAYVQSCWQSCQCGFWLVILHGGEYCSKEFEIFCAEHDIRRELIIIYAPQQNGVSKRKNRMILNIVRRNLLTQGKVPKIFFLPKVVNWSVDILNRSPMFTIQILTREQNHIIFAFAHVLIKKGRNLVTKLKSVFIGASETSKTYKLCSLCTKKIVTSRDDWNSKQPTQVFLDGNDETKQILASFISK
ncbi:hypothetical protein CR513_43860, partial [Mucuna pruriens]